jgi:acyl transferase domain-containing protein
MALVGLPAAEVTELAPDLPELYLAVISSPVQCVVTGDAAQVAELARRVSAGGGAARVLRAEGAGHSPQVDPLLGELTAQLAGLTGQPPQVRFYATAQEPRTTPACDAAYWAANLRQPVQLGPAVAAAVADGLRAFVEVSPHPMLARALTESGAAVVTGTLRRDPGMLHFHSQLAKLAAGGVAMPRRRAPVIDLPPAP